MKIKMALHVNNPRVEEGYPIRGGNYVSPFRPRTKKVLEELVDEFTMKERIAEKKAEVAAEAEAEFRRREEEREEDERYAEMCANRWC